MVLSQPFPDAGAFERGGAAVAGGLLLLVAGGADLPVAAVDAGKEGRVAFEAPQVTADEAQAHGRVADGVYGGAIHRVRFATVGTGGDRRPPKVSVRPAVLLDGDKERVLNVV